MYGESGLLNPKKTYRQDNVPKFSVDAYMESCVTIANHKYKTKYEALKYRGMELRGLVNKSNTITEQDSNQITETITKLNFILTTIGRLRGYNDTIYYTLKRMIWLIDSDSFGYNKRLIDYDLNPDTNNLMYKSTKKSVTKVNGNKTDEQIKKEMIERDNATKLTLF